MTAFDTNVLVYAHRSESPFHRRAKMIVQKFAEGEEPWSIPWPVAHEFLGVVSHPRIFEEPTRIDDALRQLAYWAASPTHRFIGEAEGYIAVLQALLMDAHVAGPKVHDARIVALCLANGVDRLISMDRDFSRFGNDLLIEYPK